MFTISWYFIGLSRFYIICSPACLVFCISSRAAVQLLQWLQWQWPCTPGHWTLGSRKNSVRLIIVSVYSGAAAAAAPPHWPHSVIITVFNYFLLTAGCWCRGQDTRLLRVPVMTRHRSQITTQQPRTHTHYTQLRGCVKYKHELAQPCLLITVVIRGWAGCWLQW